MNRLHFFLEQIVNSIPGVQPPGRRMLTPTGGENENKTPTAARGVGLWDNSWTLLQLFKDSVLFWEGVYFGLGDFWFFYNEDLRLKRDWQQRLGSGPCWPGSSGFWILLCASNCRTGLGIVRGKFCQNIFWIFYHFCKLCTENEKHKAHPLKKKKRCTLLKFLLEEKKNIHLFT